MTEPEWLACQEPQVMLDFLQASGKISDRKLKSFALACCYRVRHLVPDEKICQVPERFECVAGTDIDFWFFRGGMGVEGSLASHTKDHAASDSVLSSLAAANISWATARIATRAGSGIPFDHIYQVERTAQAALLRDIVAPFRPAASLDASLTSAVLLLAKTIYEERSFNRLPELAQALAAAGCTDVGLLAHLRSPGPHVRGCFALDALLGKK